ncbi:MAG TPA: endonuclease VIII [Sedimenticola sp.]|nr:endonuclease VIII [Sedimenticola sp.]
MPEGPEIRRAADSVGAAIKNRIAVEVRFGLPRLKPREAELRGERVREVESRGKAMLIRFANGLNIYSHNQLYGRWHTGPAYEFPDSRRQLRLAIHNREHSALLYSASDIAVLEDEALAEHPFLRRLGPDVLAAGLSEHQVIERLLRPEHRRRQLGGLLTDQSFLAGLGNYLRCEILFVAGLSPRARPQDCDPERLERLAGAILRLPRQSYQTGGITNDRQRAGELLAQGASFEEARFFVFRRKGKPCYRCGGAIERVMANGQPCYFCPRCQAP